MANVGTTIVNSNNKNILLNISNSALNELYLRRICNNQRTYERLLDDIGVTIYCDYGICLFYFLLMLFKLNSFIQLINE